MQTNDVVSAKVVEVLKDGSLILSFQGKLIRVQNKSYKQYDEQQSISLKVRKVRPLEFQIL